MDQKERKAQDDRGKEGKTERQGERDGKEEANLERFGASCSCTASYLISVF